MKLSTFVDLVTDTRRRDLTINAIACESYMPNLNVVKGLVDPYDGAQDIKDKVFRPVSDHFMEDPVRVLRVARLRARFGQDWKLSTELVEMCSKMSKKGVLSELQPDRIWKEVSRALMENHPRLFFDTLLEVDALHVVFPEVYKLKTALESRRWHPEGDAFEHTMLVLTAAAKMNASLSERFASVCHDLGKGVTPRDKLPAHHGHEVSGVAVVESLAKRMSVPSEMIKDAKLATRYHMHMHKLKDLNAKTIVGMLDQLGANHLHNTATSVLRMVGAADERGRLGSENNSLDFLNLFDDFVEAYRSVTFASVFGDSKVNHKLIQNAMTKARVKAVATAKGKNL